MMSSHERVVSRHSLNSWHRHGSKYCPSLLRKVRYVLRHYIPYDSDSKPVEMNGYGVEMAIKNMEYKAVDDRAVHTFAGMAHLLAWRHVHRAPHPTHTPPPAGEGRG